jgi:hypothetical protein
MMQFAKPFLPPIAQRLSVPNGRNPQTWEHIENKGPGKAFFVSQTWERIEK